MSRKDDGMKITIQKDIIWFGVWFVLLSNLGFFNSIVPILSGDLGDILQFVLLLAVSLYAFVVLLKRRILSQYTTLNFYVIVYCICILISLIYTIGSGRAEFTHAIRYSFSYFAIVFVYALLYLKTKNIEWNRFVDSMMNATLFMTIVKAGNCIKYDVTGQEMFSELLAGQIRNEHSTAVCSALDMLMLVWFAYRILSSSKKRKIYIVSFLWGFIYIVRFVGSRMVILSILVAIAVMWLTKNEQLRKRMFAIGVLGVGIVVFVMTPFFKDIIETLTNMNVQDVANNRVENTASVRLYTIAEVSDNLDGNVLGMGMVSYGTEEFEEIFTIGSNDDLGFLGNFFTFGVCALPMIFLLIRLYVRRIKSETIQQRKCLLLGLLAFLLFSGISLSAFDLSRVFGIPIILALVAEQKECDTQICRV